MLGTPTIRKEKEMAIEPMSAESLTEISDDMQRLRHSGKPTADQLTRAFRAARVEDSDPIFNSTGVRAGGWGHAIPKFWLVFVASALPALVIIVVAHVNIHSEYAWVQAYYAEMLTGTVLASFLIAHLAVGKPYLRAYGWLITSIPVLVLMAVSTLPYVFLIR